MLFIGVIMVNVRKLKFPSFLIFLLLFTIKLDAIPIRPIPWVTSDAVFFLDKFMKQNPQASVLEFGSGSSTIWFAKRTENLISVEHDKFWHKKICHLIDVTPECNPVNLILRKRPYYTICKDLPEESFDLILVDGRNRKGCILHSIRLLKPGGVLMLDNAERPYYKKALNLLKNWKSKKTTQKKPDSCGFIYPNWQTHWFVKPQ